MEIKDLIDFNILAKLIGIVDDLYSLICVGFSDIEPSLRINLKKKLVRDVYTDTINNYFDSYIKRYKNLLALPHINTYIVNSIGIYDERFFIYQTRVKRQESINYKLFKKSKDSGGTYKLIDILNDLYGVRFKIKGYNNIKSNIEEAINFNKYYSSIKFLRRVVNNGSYKVDHIYFRSKESNWIFPIELQLWDFEDCDNNDESHKLYKRDYIHWV